MSNKGTKRKKTAEINDDYAQFLELVADGCPELEIAVLLNLSAVQLKGHTLKALQSEDITAAALKPNYEAVYAKALPKAVRKLMSLESDDDGEALVKVEAHGSEVILTLLRAASPRKVQPAPDSTEEQSVTDDVEEELA